MWCAGRTSSNVAKGLNRPWWARRHMSSHRSGAAWTPHGEVMRRVPEPLTFPRFIEPKSPQLVEVLPEGEDWPYEVRLDGDRTLLLKNGQEVEFRSRKDKDLTTMYPSVAAAGLKLHAEQAVLDGEIVALDRQGRPSFQALQHRSLHPGHTIFFYAFDLLHLNGKDLTSNPLIKRRAALAKVLGDSGLLVSREWPGSLATIIEAVRGLKLEGIIAKRKNSRYESGEPSGHWLKLKLEQQQEFVIGGYRPSSSGIDTLLVRYYERGGLRFGGKVLVSVLPLLLSGSWPLIRGARNTQRFGVPCRAEIAVRVQQHGRRIASGGLASCRHHLHPITQRRTRQCVFPGEKPRCAPLGKGAAKPQNVCCNKL